MGEKEQTALALTHLTPDELAVYEKYRASGKPPLSVKLSTSLYELWLQGVSMDEMVELNKGLSLGAIIQCRIENRWDERRGAYVAQLMVEAQDRMRMIALESANFIGVLLAVAQKRHGSALKKYLQTGDEAHLTGFDIQSIQQYKAVIETLAKITGQDSKRDVKVSGEVKVDAGGTVPSSITPEQAAAILKLLEEKQK